MIADVLLNLLNKFGKSDRMRGLPSILLLFHKFNKLNNAGAGKLDSIYHVTLHFEIALKKSRFCDINTTL